MRYLKPVLTACLLIFILTSCRSGKNFSHTEKKESLETKKVSDEISDKKLAAFINDWYGVPYQYGGNDKTGIDCSHFTIRLYEEVYQKNITGPAAALEKQSENVSSDKLQEGTLVFFKIEQPVVSHVGVYVGHHKFVHASTSKGVVISDLNEAYYKKYFYKAGKIK